MNEPEIYESRKSWRKTPLLMIEEGRKRKVSNKFVQGSLWALGLAVLLFQIFSMYRPALRKKADIIFIPPDLNSASRPTYIPQLMNREQEVNIEKAKAREMTLAKQGKPPPVERIKSVKLGPEIRIPPGSEVFVTLTSGTNGMLKAILPVGLKADGDVLLPPGTVLLGSGSSSDERLFMAFTKAILPDHTSLKIKALAYDSGDRILGIKGKKVSDYAFRLAASSGLIFLGGMADGLREEVSLTPGEHRRPSVRDAALNGVTTATSEVGKDMIEKMKSSENRVEVAHSTSVLVIFDDPPEK